MTSRSSAPRAELRSVPSTVETFSPPPLPRLARTHHLFLDESGEFGSQPGSSSFFVICVLHTESEKAVRKRLWKGKAKLIADGWPQDIEIKGNSLWKSAHNPRIPQRISDRRVEILGEIIREILSGPVKIYYSVVRKDRLRPHVRAADYGIPYNYFSGQLLCKAHKNFCDAPIHLIADQRSKETHHKHKFDGYIATRIMTDCDHEHGVTIEHLESSAVPGLQAVDFLSWGLFRYYEHNDAQFRDIIAPRVTLCDPWYPGK